MDKNFKIMEALNYSYDNPECRDKVKPDEMIIKTAAKSVLDPNVLEQIALYASMSQDLNAYKIALTQQRELANMTNGIDRLRVK